MSLRLWDLDVAAPLAERHLAKLKRPFELLPRYHLFLMDVTCPRLVDRSLSQHGYQYCDLCGCSLLKGVAHSNLKVEDFAEVYTPHAHLRRLYQSWDNDALCHLYHMVPRLQPCYLHLDLQIYQ